MLLVASGEETMNPKELLLSAFEDVVFLQDLVARVGLPLPMVWEVVLSLGKLGIIVTMFLGRVGIFTALVAMGVARERKELFVYPEERVLI